jgi:hypothetical protein
MGMDMDFLGAIEPDHDASADQNKWIALVGAHSSLAPGKPQQGINPFTKNAHVYKPAPDYAHVLLDGTEVGAIHWAMDNSHRLVVWSVAAAKSHVKAVAQDVASRLSWRFVLRTDA